MASDAERVVSIIFNGVDNVSSVSGKIGSQLSAIGNVIERVARPFAVLGENILKTEVALGTLTGATMAYSIKKFSDFQDVMLTVKGIMQASDEDYERLTALVKELGATTRYTASEAAEGLKFLAMAGLDVDESIGALPMVLNLAQAAAMDLGEAADITTNIMTGYGLEVSDLARINDTLTATFTNSNTNLSELGQAFKYAGPIAASFGLDIEEVAAILGTMANAGYKANMAGTSLRNVMLALVAPAGNVSKLMKDLGVDTTELGIDFGSSAEALKSLGVEVKGADGNLRPLTDIIADLKVGLERIPDPADRTATVMEIFGKRGGPQLQALLDQGADSISNLEGKIRSLGGVTADIAETMESGIGGTIRLIKSSFEAVVLNIGEQLSQGTVPAGQGMAKILQAIRDSVESGAMDEIFDAFEQVGINAGETFGAIAEAMPEALEMVDFEGFLESLGNLGGAFKDIYDMIFGDLDLTKPEDLAQAIQKVVDTITTLTNVTSGIVEEVSPLIEMFVNLTEKTNKWDAETQKAMGNRLADAMIIDRYGAAAGSAAVFLATLGNSAETVDEILTDLNILGDPFSAMTYGAEDATKAIERVPPAVEDIHAALADMPPVEIVDPKKTETDMGELWDVVKGACDEINANLKTDGGAKVPATVDEESVNEAKRTLEKTLPKTHEVDVRLKQELVRAQTEITTATIRSETEKWKSMFESVNVGIESTGNTLQSFWNTLAGGDLSLAQQMSLESYMRKEEDRRREEFELQKRLSEQQITLNRLKAESLERGDALITVEGSGLQPHLEAFMWEILEAIQIRANATGAEFLLGV